MIGGGASARVYPHDQVERLPQLPQLPHDAAVLPLSLPPLAAPVSQRQQPSAIELRAFVTEHHAFAWRMVRRLGVLESSVDDAVQQVFMVVTQRLGDVELGKERSFLVSTIMRVAANMRRAQSRVKEDPWNDNPPEVASDAPTPEESLSQAERRALLDAVLAPLPLDQRTVFVLAELEGMSAPEIGLLIDVPVGTVASRLRRARELVEQQVRIVKARASSSTTASSSMTSQREGVATR